MSGDLTARYLLYVICLFGSLLPAAAVGWVVAVRGAIFDESVSTQVFVLSAVSAATVAGVTFFFLMKAFSDQGGQLLPEVCFVVCLSAFALIVLGKAAAKSASLGVSGAGGIWLLLMLTLGFVPFARNWGEK